MDGEYKDRTPHAAIVRDFIAGMTDNYFVEQCPDHLKPSLLNNHV
jgi:dGTPase